MKLIVGLGNPGEKYQDSRHNIGFWVIDELAQKHELRFQKNSEYESLIARGTLSDQDFLLAKPMTYMNQSGRAFSKLLTAFNILPADTLVILDDIFLNVGYLRFRLKGTAGGHRGLESILAFCSQEPIARLRLGVGFPENQSQGWSDHVLGSFQKDDLDKVQRMVSRSVDIVGTFITEGSEAAQKWVGDSQSKGK